MSFIYVPDATCCVAPRVIPTRNANIARATRLTHKQAILFNHYFEPAIHQMGSRPLSTRLVLNLVGVCPPSYPTVRA